MFKKLLFTITISSLTIATLLFSGCFSNNNTDNTSSNIKKDELILAIGSEPEAGFDPTTGWGRYGSPLFQSTLLKRDSDMEIVNDIATEYTISADGLVWTVKIRDDVKFSDGKPLTAADVVYTYETTSRSSSVVDLSVMDNVESPDDYTIKFKLKAPHSTFINTLAHLGIVPKHKYSEDYSQKPIGSGPFKFVQWDKGQQLIIEANPYYYGNKPYFKKITFIFLSEETTFAAALAGNVDVASITPSYANQTVPGMRLVSLESIDNRGIMFPYIMSGNKTNDGYQIGNDVTSDLSIRKAINIVIDRNALVNGILNGHGSPSFSVCDKMPWWNPDSVILDADIESAKKILADGGWEYTDGDGILNKGSIKAEFNLIYPASDQTRQFLAIAVADQIKEIGIKVNVEGRSFDAIESLMHSNAVLFGWGSHDPIEMYNIYNSKYMGVGWYNTGYYSNTTVDNYMNNALLANNEKQANEYWQKAQWDGETGFSTKGDAPWAWLINLNHLYFVKDNLNIGKQKIQPHGHGWPLTDNIENWYWEN